MLPLNLPNILTLARMAAVPFLVVLLHFPGPTVCLLAMWLFVLAAVTDIVDGMLARRWGLVTTLGKFLDPLADKLLICSVLVMLVQLGWIPAWTAIVVISRELLVTGLRAVAADAGMVIAADRYGKWKTITQSVALAILVVHYPLLGLNLQPLGMVIFYVAVALTVASGANYLNTFASRCMLDSGENIAAPEGGGSAEG